MTTLAIFSRSNTFVEAFKNYGVWIVALLLNAILLWLTNDLSIDFTDEGRKVPIGIYIAFFECYNLKGDLQRIKKSFVVAGKL